MTADMGYGTFDKFKAKYPDRYINVGISEQFAVDFASGIAKKGYPVIILPP